MKQFPLPLCVSQFQPVLLVFGTLVGLFSFQSEVSRSYFRVEQESIRQARFFGNQTSGMLEYLYRNRDVKGAELLLSQLGADSNLQLALLSDENDRVILATRYELRNRLVITTSAANSLLDIKKTRQTISGKVTLAKNRQSLWAMYPVLFPATDGELISSRVGVLLLKYDLATTKAQAYRDALWRSLKVSACLALLCTVVWLFFNKTLTKRAVRLVETTKLLSQGKFDVSAKLQGSDELKQISTAFDQMANQIKLNQQKLQDLATQREELLNLLASQIRSSFDLETILSTAVSETRNLLEVDRCNFLWYCFDDQTLNAHISHEARLPGLPGVLGKYPHYELNSPYQDAIRNFQTVRVDNLTTDTSLDASMRKRLIAQGYKSFSCCPIQTHSGRIGLICCAHCYTTHFWSDDEIELLQSVANQLAIAINQAELYEQARAAATAATKQAEQLRQALQELQQTQALLGATLDSTADGILVVDQSGKIASFNRKFVEMWHIPDSVATASAGNHALAFVLEQLINPEAFINKLRELEVQPHVESHDLVEFKNNRIFESYSRPQHLNGKIVGRVWSFRDITERKRAEDKIQYQVFHDLLTELPNRMLFNERLSLALANARQYQVELAVMFMDLDRFKTINDTLGHACGDLLLQSVARRLTSCLREGDTVARWGGDEFTLLLPQIVDQRDAIKIAQRILAALRPAFDLQGHQLHVTNSIGIAFYPHDGKDAETLLKNADAALYRAKERGRNNYQIYTPSINPAASELLTLENSLHHALERGELMLYYQPQINVNTWEITGMEALLRWQHPTLGLVSPGVFIPLAEANGLIVPIGEWVLHTACLQNQVWQDLGLQGLRVAVNLSARQFQQPNLVALVERVLAETKLQPHCLELEITETTMMQNVEAKSILLQLQQMGIYIAIDDFGTGYSSLSYLKKFPLNTIKLDRSFIRDLAVDTYDQAIATAVIAMGHGLNLNVVAEGVETKEQLDSLRLLNCREIQGYLFSHPLPVAAATELLCNSWAQTKKHDKQLINNINSLQ